MSMEHIGARQIKAARALLDWSQEDLALATSLSVATIRKLELGYISPRSSTVSVLRRTFEEAGIEFLELEGVRRRQEDVVTYQGGDAYENFFDDIAHASLQRGGEILIVADSSFGTQGVFDAHMLRRFEMLLTQNPALSAKVILTDIYDLPFSPVGLECRVLSTNYVDPMPFCVYADRYAMITVAEEKAGRIIVVKSTTAAQASRRHFYSMWEKAMSLQAQASTAKKTRGQAART